MADQDPLLAWLFSLQGPALKWEMDTIQRFLGALGDPQNRFPAIHVAGTNGKGSVAAMLHCSALAAGLVAGLNTSPHLVCPEERIRIGASDIGPADFRRRIADLRVQAAALTAQGRLPRHPSFFEMMTAIAFLSFAERPVDLAIVETGLGGRLDATNVLLPRLSIITTIGLDHVKTLGGTLKTIAAEKAGIIKPGRPVLAGWIPKTARLVLAERARAGASPVFWAQDEIKILRRAGRIEIRTPQASYRDLDLALTGPHQQRNAALAIRAAEIVSTEGIEIPPHAVRRGLAEVRWPGRLESIGASPRFLLDGAHNPEGARALARALALRDQNGAPLRRVLVFGVSEGRQGHTLLQPFQDRVQHVLVTRAGIAKAVDPQLVAEDIRHSLPGLPVDLVEDVDQALIEGARLAGTDGEVLVTGSLYLVGDARRVLLGLRGAGHPLRETDIAPSRPAI